MGAQRTKYKECETERRKVRELLEIADDHSTRMALERKHTLAKLRSRAAAESLQKSLADVEVIKQHREIATMRSELLRAKVDRLRQSVVFSTSDLNQKRLLVDQAEANLRRDLNRLQIELQTIGRQWSAVEQVYRSAASPSRELTAKVAALKLAHESAQEKVSLANQVLQEIGVIRICWRYRYEVAKVWQSAEEMRDWAKEIELARKRTAQFEQLIELRIDGRRGDLARAAEATDGVRP